MTTLRALPNILTLLRVAAIPFVVATFYVGAAWAAWAGCAVFLCAAATDFFDGYLARRWNVVSVFGKLLDPIADKLLVAATLFALAAFDRLGPIAIIAGLVILLREVLISGVREFLAGRGAPGLPVSRLAKWKTTVQMLAMALLIVAPTAPNGWPASEVGVVALWLAAVLTAITGYTYCQQAWQQVAQGTSDGG